MSPTAPSTDNSATVSARTFDPDLDNNTDDASTTVVHPRPTCAIAKALTSPQLIPGQSATYSVAVTNLGPSVSAGPFTITDTLPPASTFVSAAGPGWTCQPIAAGAVGATLSCTHPASLSVGEVTADLVVTVGIPASQTTNVVNTAPISATTTTDPNPGNDSADGDAPRRHRRPT